MNNKIKKIKGKQKFKQHMAIIKLEYHYVLLVSLIKYFY